MLTERTLKAAATKQAAWKLWDTGGLYLAVLPSGRRSWRLKARAAGKELLLTLGLWPAHSLGDARAWRDQVRERIARGLDPRVVPAAETFEVVARRWHAARSAKWTPVHAGDVLVSLERDAFPAIGAKAIASIGAPEILELLERVGARGARATAARLRQRLSGVFRYAIARELASADPAAAVADELAAARPPRRQPALVDLDQVRELLAIVARLRAGTSVQLAHQLLALTGVRLAVVRGARWGEIEDLDGPAPTWRVPAARMKLTAAKKADATNDHLVPLSKQAVTVLRRAKHMVVSLSDETLIFPGRGAGRPLGEAAIGELYDRAGYAGRHVPHGWRASLSTICNERGVASRGEIDRALGHAGGGRAAREEGVNVKVEGAYNRATHLPERRALFQAWADLIAPLGASPDLAGRGLPKMPAPS